MEDIFSLDTKAQYLLHQMCYFLSTLIFDPNTFVGLQPLLDSRKFARIDPTVQISWNENINLNIFLRCEFIYLGKHYEFKKKHCMECNGAEPI